MPPLVPTVAIGFNWKRATPLAANVAIISSLIVNLGFKLIGISLPYNIDVGAFSLFLSLTLFLGISIISEPVKLKREIEETIDF